MLSKPAFGIYIHIPYCIQRCLYCDFATYEKSQIFPPEEYIQLLIEEMRQKAKYYEPQEVDTIYFGGGTPSLIEPELLAKAINELENLGFKPKASAELTIEINPATVTAEKMKSYREMGINRYSVGAQTFKDTLLKKLGREHNAQQTRETLNLLRSHSQNFNFDILFALPHQSLDDLRDDLQQALQQGAQHISPYCLTIPKGHILQPGRAPDEEQVEMFAAIKSELVKKGYQQYEISNFALPGFESRHNLLYWTDKEYWGLGLSAHSYSKSSPWGTRYWNPSAIGEYKKQILEHNGKVYLSPDAHLPESQFELLEKYQSLTDFCHTSLRLMAGLSLSDVQEKYGASAKEKVEIRLASLMQRKLVETADNQQWKLTNNGLLLSNLVFEKMTFLRADLPA
jgi:oxygen-independent coproporphyrinogen-3 oxidase